MIGLREILCPRCRFDYLRMEEGEWAARGGCEWIEDDHDTPLRTDYPFAAKFWCSFCEWETPLYRHDDELPILDFEAEVYSWLDTQIGLAEKNNEHATFFKNADVDYREVMLAIKKHAADKIARNAKEDGKE